MGVDRQPIQILINYDKSFVDFNIFRLHFVRALMQLKQRKKKKGRKTLFARDRQKPIHLQFFSVVPLAFVDCTQWTNIFLSFFVRVSQNAIIDFDVTEQRQLLRNVIQT